METQGGPARESILESWRVVGIVALPNREEFGIPARE